MNTDSITTYPKTKINGFILKLIAIFSMLIDHIGAVFFPQIDILRHIGRLAFPVFCFFIVEGYFHTKDVKRYLFRLFLFALISEIPFDLAFNNKRGSYEINFLSDLNVFFTLFFGLFIILIIDKLINKRVSLEQNKYSFIFSCIIYILITLLTLFLAEFLDTDYGAGGVLLIIFLYLYRNNQIKKIISSSLILFYFFGLRELPALISYIPLMLYNGKRGPSLKFVFYIFYPLHLIVLFLIRELS